MARDIYEDHDEVEEAPKDGLGTGLIIMTTILLLLALFTIQTAMKDHFNEGMFADKTAPAG